MVRLICIECFVGMGRSGSVCWYLLIGMFF